MKRMNLLLLLATGLTLALPVQAQVPNETLFGFTGFDYQMVSAPMGGNIIIGDQAAQAEFLDNVGDGYAAVGFVTSFASLLAGSVNTTDNEYTFHLQDGVVNATVFAGGFLEVVFDPGARMRVYEDAVLGGTAGDYGVNPPNGTAPSSFSDGTMILGMALSNLHLFYDYNANAGAIDANATLDEGTLLGLIHPARRNGWLLSGQAGRPNGTIPAGYENQLSGDVQIPGATPTARQSWGAVKALYR